jgi:hypothetical protein
VTEKWRALPGYEGIYEVSDQGNVKSLSRKIWHPHRGELQLQERILRPANTRYGKRMVALRKDGKSRSFLVHRLVLEAFVGTAPEGTEACHTNDIGHDNRLENLRWDTRRENIFDQVRNGRHWSARKTHCKSGHEFNAENTRYRRCGARACRQCENNRRKKV